MAAFSSGNNIVDEVGKIPFTGNILAHNWFNTIKLENGKPDSISIILLSEIVYWYKPTEVKDEKTGLFLGYKKKFKADLLQRSYESFSNQFGFTKRQVKESCKRLEDLGVITRHFRTVTSNGMLMNNVLFIELHTEKLKAVTLKSVPSDIIMSQVSQNNVTGITLKRQTNTKSTTENTTKITTTKNISLQIENLRQRYSENQLKIIDDYLEMIKHTRVSGKISDSVILRMYESWNSYPTICVEYGLYVHTIKVEYHSRKENYTLGIIKNTTAEESVYKLQQLRGQAPTTNNKKSLFTPSAETLRKQNEIEVDLEKLAKLEEEMPF